MDAEQAYPIHMGWIEKCIEDDRMTAWETEFIYSLRGQLEKRRFLSPRQIEILERIYTDKTS